MSNITKDVSRVVLRDNILDSVKHTESYKRYRELLSDAYSKREKDTFSNAWIHFSYKGKEGYWNKAYETAIPVQSVYSNTESSYFDAEYCELHESAAVKLFNSKSRCPESIIKGIKASKAFNGGHWIGYKNGSFCIETERFSNWNDSDSIKIGTVRITENEFRKSILTGKYDIIDDDILNKAVDIIKNRPLSELSEDEIDKLNAVFGIDTESVRQETDKKLTGNFVMSEEITELYIRSLLECDTARADLEKYDRKCLEDINSGHWELWSDDEPCAGEGQIVAELEHPLRARDPISDIHKNGLIGIDFGTKSTIVSVQDGNEFTTLLRVGIGRLNKAPEAHHYENPTIMEFIDIEKFLKDYNSRSGRPETSINDLRVSHAAARDLNSCDNNSFFDSFFYDIKQWCGDEKRSIKITDQQNKNIIRELPPYAELGSDDFDPLELYAYYLGLYINNMHRGIYLDYVLSFPVTYKLDVKNRILESFKAGLWKSLPESLQKNEDIAGRFRVKLGVSEPAAYAITALKGYGFDPDDENEKYLYAIFDFGGGTTDFDFGIWRGANDALRDEEDKDYVIEHINSEGDKYLGGENLLELLAFEVFKANNDFMRTGKESGKEDSKTESVGFSFTVPHGCIVPSGCETTVKNTPSAKRNTKQLMEVLRPFWEGIISVASDEKDAEDEENSKTKNYCGYVFRNDETVKFPVNDGSITVDLFDNNGNFHPGQKLYIDKQEGNIHVDLVKILEERIERGVTNFFDSVMLMFTNETARRCGLNEMQIFLAGNSSRSPILKKLFDKYIIEMDKKINGGTNGDSHFELFPPLGTADSNELLKDMGLEVNTDITAPTGKTGVAYGLIEGRDGGPILVISEITADSQSKFRFNVGKAKKGKFHMVLDRNEAVYDQWVRFSSAGSEDFEIYYTSLPSAMKMPVSDAGVHKIRCRLDNADANADIFIRTTEDAPEDIEYCVADVNGPDGSENVIRVHLDE